MKYILCFLCLKPDKLFLNFINSIQNEKYQVYLCIDDNSYKIDSKYENINVIQINNHICEEAGYKSLVGYFYNKTCSKDKALYYFNKNNIDYDYIWLIEDDVFIPYFDTIRNIDIKYNENNDFITQKKVIIENVQTRLLGYWWWGDQIEKQFSYFKKFEKSKYKKIFYEKDLSKNMTCAIRLSKKFMKIIDDFVTYHKKLFMDELFFINIAIFENLKIKYIPELKNITWVQDVNEWPFEKIEIDKLYHPIKNHSVQEDYRKKLNLK